MDRAWWDVYLNDVREQFRGRLMTVNDVAGVERLSQGFKAFGNSGAGAINLAALNGAQRVVLLGFDCQHTNGQRHHHGDHPKQLGNAANVAKWPAQFARLAASLSIEVINASRDTALEVFERQPLSVALKIRGAA